jgi:general secretion pathway protein G
VGQKLLMVDACRNDASSGRGRGVAAALVSLPEQTWVLLSCSRRERAFETKKLGGGHGVFFYHVLEGLRGKAADEDGEVTWGRLAEYVSKNVPKVVPDIIGGGAEQHPHELKSGAGVITLARITIRPPLDEPGGSFMRAIIPALVGREQAQQTKNQIKNLQNILIMYSLEHGGTYPKGGRSALNQLTAPGEYHGKKISAYLDDVPKDGWGKPLYYEYPTRKGKGEKPAIWSSGPNEKNEEGRGDDINSWSEQ